MSGRSGKSGQSGSVAQFDDPAFDFDARDKARFSEQKSHSFIMDGEGNVYHYDSAGNKYIFQGTDEQNTAYMGRRGSGTGRDKRDFFGVSDKALKADKTVHQTLEMEEYPDDYWDDNQFDFRRGAGYDPG